MNCSQSNDLISNEMLTISIANGTHIALAAGCWCRCSYSRNVDAPTKLLYNKGNKNKIVCVCDIYVMNERTRKQENGRRLLTHFKEMFILSFSDTLSALCEYILKSNEFID